MTRARPRTEPRAVRVKLLGRFAVYRDGELLTDGTLGSLKGRLLLKLLAVRRGHLVPTDRIIETLWPDGAPAHPEENVAVLVSRLRSVLGLRVLQGGRPGYLLWPGEGCSVDLDDAERLVAEARTASERGDVASARTAAEAALVVLGAADLLEDEPYADWADSERMAARRLLREARHLAADLAARRGDHDLARTLSEALIETEPLDEEANRRLILARYRLGEKAGALAAFEAVRSTLAEELGTDPSRETQELYLAVLRDEVPAESAAEVPGFGPVGRAHEMRRLEGVWEEALAAGPILVLLFGESGIGKSFLVDEFAARVERAGALVLRARCAEMERSLVLQPIVDALRNTLLRTVEQPALAALPTEHRAVLGELIPEVGVWTDAPSARSLSPEAQRHRWFGAVASLLAELCRARPVLLVLDDMQHAGDTTLEFVHVLTRRRSAGPLMTVGLAQGEEAASLEGFGSLARVIELGPLSDEAVGALATRAGFPEAAERLHEVSGGNPLYLAEAIRSLRESGTVRPTESVRVAVIERIRRCGTEVGELLRAASVLGLTFDPLLVAELIECPPIRAARLSEEAFRRDLLREAEVGYAFAHEIVRDTVYESVPRPTRVAMHRSIARILEKRGEREEIVGHHAARGLQHDLASRAFLAAARRASRSFANAEAEELLGRALESADALGELELTAEILLERGEVRIALDTGAAAIGDLQRGLSIARETADGPLEARILEQLGFGHYSGRDLVRAKEFTDRALAHPDHGGSARTLSARVHHALGHLRVAEDEARAALAAADSEHDDTAGALARSYLGSIKSHSDDYSSAVSLLEEAEQSSRSVGSFRSTFNSLFFLGHALGNSGDIPRALEVFDRLLTEARDVASMHYETRALNCLGWLWLELGDTSQAIDLVQRSLEGSGDPALEEPRANGLLLQADGALRLGDPDRAATLATQAERLGVAAAYGWRFELRVLELRARLATSNDSVEIAMRLAELGRERGAPKYEALGLALAGKQPEAAAIARRLASDLLLSKVSTTEEAAAAVARLASRLPEPSAALFVRSREGIHE